MKPQLSLRQTIEKNFLDKTNQVFQMDKSREIKFFSCIGDPPIGLERRQEEENRRKQEEENRMMKLEEEGRKRNEVEFDNEMATKEQEMPGFRPKWDEFKNDRLSWRAKVILKLLKRPFFNFFFHILIIVDQKIR